MKIKIYHEEYKEKVSTLDKEALDALTLLLSGRGPGNDYLSWLDWPKNYEKEEFLDIKKAASTIRENSQILIVIGIGGSYLGARAIIEALKETFSYDNIEILFAGQNLSSSDLYDLLSYIEDKDFSINIISKSGTTLEPALAFRLLKKILEDRYGKDGARDRIYVTTDQNKGALRELANTEGYKSFVVPDDMGGRYSVLSGVGLFPLAVSGIDIDRLMIGAQTGRKKYIIEDFYRNPALQYAAYRNYFYRQGKKIEITASYEPRLKYLLEWWKQLFGESEGKESKGIFPVSVAFTSDLHSLGQIIQEGERNIFETTLTIDNPPHDLIIPQDDKNLDGLNYLAGRSLDYVNKQAKDATIQAHLKGGVPQAEIIIEKLDEESLGELIYFYQISAAISGYILGVNPFNQPGVEEYKKNMFTLLGKKL